MKKLSSTCNKETVSLCIIQYRKLFSVLDWSNILEFDTRYYLLANNCWKKYFCLCICLLNGDFNYYKGSIHRKWKSFYWLAIRKLYSLCIIQYRKLLQKTVFYTWLKWYSRLWYEILFAADNYVRKYSWMCICLQNGDFNQYKGRIHQNWKSFYWLGIRKLYSLCIIQYRKLFSILYWNDILDFDTRYYFFAVNCWRKCSCLFICFLNEDYNHFEVRIHQLLQRECLTSSFYSAGNPIYTNVFYVL